MKKIDLESLSEKEVESLTVEIGTKMRELIDSAIASYKEKTGESLLFSYKIATKLKISKNKEESDIAKLENEINKELNKLVKRFGLKTQLTLARSN